MLTTIKTEYRGFELGMDEETEAWSCHDLGIRSEEMLGFKSIKAKIDKILKDGRKLGDLKVLKLSGGAGRFNGTVEVVEVTATLLCAPEKDGYGSNAGPDRIKSCWVTNKKGERIKCRLDSLYPVEAVEQIKAWRIACGAADEAAAYADQLEKALPAFQTAEAMWKAAREAKVTKAEAEA